MPHCLIAGITESGKTTLAKQLARNYRENGKGVIVLDPMNDPGWQADYQTSNPDEFIAIAKGSKQCALFVDESGETIGRYKNEMFWLATQSRHWGHNSHFIVQRVFDLGKTVRDQCQQLFLFCVSMDDAKILANEWNKPELKNCNQLNQFEFFYCTRFGAARKLQINP